MKYACTLIGLFCAIVAIAGLQTWIQALWRRNLHKRNADRIFVLNSKMRSVSLLLSFGESRESAVLKEDYRKLHHKLISLEENNTLDSRLTSIARKLEVCEKELERLEVNVWNYSYVRQVS